MAIPKKIYDTVSKNIVLNVYKYFNDEAMKLPPNHPERSYVKKKNSGGDWFASMDHLLDMSEPQVFYGKFLCCS